MNTPEHLTALRAAIDAASGALSVLDCEAWARRETWAAASEALPLLVGLRPDAWASFLAISPRAAQAEALWQSLAWQLSIDPREDPPMPPLRLRAAAEAQGWTLPADLARLLDFIARVLPVAEASGDTASEARVLAAQERETLLGAALLLVTRMPGDCVDALGYYDPQRIARLIRAKAVLWFPLEPPSLDEDGIARLLAKWLPGRGTD